MVVKLNGAPADNIHDVGMFVSNPMSVLSRMTRFLGSAARQSREPDYRAVEYWEDRHRALCGSLRAVGHRKVPEETNAAQYAIKRAHILNLMRRHVSEPLGKSLLDAGCGTGVLTSAYVDTGFQVVGVDFSATAVRQARASGTKADFLVAPLDTLDLKRRFDVITAVDVLMHVTSDEQARATIATLARHLHPDGALVVLDHFVDADPGRARHVRFRARAWYVEAFADVGLRVVEHEQFDLDSEGVTKDLLAVRHAAAVD